MPNFSAQPMRNAQGEIVNPLTGETVLECANRLHRGAIRDQEMLSRFGLASDSTAREAARQTATRCALSNMAQHDKRLADFYAAVAAHLSNG